MSDEKMQKMNKVVMDASALLALLNEEAGSDFVEPYLEDCVMSAVNLAECAFMLVKIGLKENEAHEILSNIVANIVVFDESQAYLCAELVKQSKQFGLSFGDRACLSLAKSEALSVVTADKVWSEVNLGVDVILIR